MSRKKRKKSLLFKKITRREFIKLAGATMLGLSFGGYLIKNFVLNKAPVALNNSLKVAVSKKHTKEVYFYTRLAGDIVRCDTCPHNCKLSAGQRGICRVKENVGGKLISFVYGNPCAVHIDPVEKKPLYHFLPTTKVFSIATAGCNFRCLNCQNWEISQFPPEKTYNSDMMPTEVVSNAIAAKCASIAYTYSEPVAFYEYMLDTSKLAKENNIKNLWITNGYLAEKPLIELSKYIDAANVDLKSFKDSIYAKLNSGTLQPVLNTLKTLKKQGVWLEVTNLVVPSYTDDLDMIKQMCKWLYDNLGADTPLHFSRFYPHYKLRHLPPTPYSTLKKARDIALKAGLHYVYVGNVLELEGQQTYCPKCGKVVVKREGYDIKEVNIVDGKCKFCGYRIAGVWSL